MACIRLQEGVGEEEEQRRIRHFIESSKTVVVAAQRCHWPSHSKWLLAPRQNIKLDLQLTKKLELSYSTKQAPMGYHPQTLQAWTPARKRPWLSCSETSAY